MSPLMSPLDEHFVPLHLPPPYKGGIPMCKRPRENPAELCQCSVDPVLSSQDMPYFEMYLSMSNFAKWSDFNPFLEVRKNFKLLEHKYITYHFETGIHNL